MSREVIVTIDTRKLQPGMYVYIDLGWMDHPFTLNRFMIKSEDQIRTIHELGIKRIRYSPSNSDSLPLEITPKKTEANPAIEITPVISPEIKAMMLKEEARKEKLEQHKARSMKCQKTIANAAKVMRLINSKIYSQPQACMDNADRMMGGFLKTLMSNDTTALFALNDTHIGEEIYVHSVNVSVLAILMAKELKFPLDVIKLVGIGSLFHDIGKLEIPNKVTRKTDPLTAAEQSLLEQHPIHSNEIMLNTKIDPGALAIMAQHHEYCDGSGYPNKLKEDEISPLAQLVAIINLYDNLCNPLNPAKALTPHDALAKLFAEYRTKLNGKILQAFIRLMGIYPPGSIVSLSNETIGIVVSVSSGKALKPTILIYDPKVPKEEAILLDLETLPDITIIKAIQPALLAPEIFSYLNPKKRITYFFDTIKS